MDYYLKLVGMGGGQVLGGSRDKHHSTESSVQNPLHLGLSPIDEHARSPLPQVYRWYSARRPGRYWT